MKHLLAKIEVWEDTESKESSFTMAEIRSDGTNPEKLWKIEIHPRDIFTPTPANTLTTLCHELGHVVSQIFKTPAVLKAREERGKAAFFLEKIGQPATQDNQQAMLARSKESMTALVTEEKEAWDNARMIYPGLNEDVAQKSFGTYLSAVKHAPYGDMFDAMSDMVVNLLARIAGLDKPRNIQPPIDDM